MSLHLRCAGKRVQAVLTNGHVLQLRMEDGSEVDIVWLDDNGKPLKGKPAIQQHGVRLQARGVQELVHHRSLLLTGEAR